MFFYTEERRAWVNSHGHTVVLERDPDYPRFANDPMGTIQYMLRIWLAELRDGRPYLCAFLGTISFWVISPSFREWHRLFRLTNRAAKVSGESAKALRRDLIWQLRKYVEERYRLDQEFPRLHRIKQETLQEL